MACTVEIRQNPESTRALAGWEALNRGTTPQHSYHVAVQVAAAAELPTNTADEHLLPRRYRLPSRWR